ncbi:MAG TPA: M13 family metallopeptidase [Pyrinomonadaceae bacterium]|jgi:putative endopeptidase|nr:M13 family metallopeptidase [Pyrinomonadaceae bacterium]
MFRPFLRFIAASAVVMSIFTSALAQSGYDTSRMDRSADACDDFFQFANGNWVKNTEIPASQSRWGSFNILAESNRDVLHTILENAVKTKAAKGSTVQLIGDYYASCIDEAAIEKAGTKPLDPYLKQIVKIKTAKDVVRQLALLHKEGVPSVFRLGGGADAKNSNMVIVNAGQGGLSLPNKDYYTKLDARSVEIRVKFLEHMTNMFKLLGDNPDTAARNAQTVMDVQTRLANASKAPVELRDPDKNYNKIPLADAQKIIPNLPLASYMKERGMPPAKEINFGQPDFFAEVNKMLADVPVDAWRTYFRWMVLSSAANALPKAFVDETFNFQGRVLSGTREQQERWKRCVGAVDNNLGEALGAEYVKTKFTPEAKARMDAMITNLFVAMKSHIENLPWMSAETKTKALAKLAAYKRKIGYNEHPRGYAGLKVDRKSYAGNELSSREFQLNRNIQDIGKPTDKTRWGMNPPLVNASYNPIFNDITFPAGILQPPFFNFQADDAINYGGIGAVIGHEISHGFDDQGSKFSPEGNLASWWTTDDRTKFEERANCVVQQFNGYEVQPGLNVNGRLTLGENIGDLGGLNIAYTALMNALAGREPAKIDGFTAAQRFFLGWAQVWAAKSTSEAERAQVLGDPHSAARWRVNGPTSNMPEFAKAFGCKQGDRMVRNKACVIW